MQAEIGMGSKFVGQSSCIKEIVKFSKGFTFYFGHTKEN